MHLLVTVVLWAVPVVLLVAFWRVPSAREAEFTSSAPAQDLVVGSRVDSLRSEVSIELAGLTTPTVRVQVGGVVTALNSRLLGAPLSEGAKLAAVNGQSVLVQTEGRPFYRQLKIGDSGQDVLDLNVILRHLGLSSTLPRSKFDDGTKAGVVRLQRLIAASVDDGVFNPGYFAFSGKSRVFAQNFLISTGETVSPGQEVLATESLPRSIQLKASDPGSTLPDYGDRAVRLSTGTASLVLRRVPIESAQYTELTAFLFEQAALGSVTAAASSGGMSYTGLNTELRDSVTLGTADASAVFTSPNGTNCVFTSSLPNTAVKLPPDLPPSSEVGVAFLPGAFIGKRLVANPLDLSAETRSSCR